MKLSITTRRGTFEITNFVDDDDVSVEGELKEADVLRELKLTTANRVCAESWKFSEFLFSNSRKLFTRLNERTCWEMTIAEEWKRLIESELT